MCALSCNIMYIPMTLVSTQMYATMKKHHVMLFAIIMQLIGVWIRFYSRYIDEWWPIVVGQIIV